MPTWKLVDADPIAAENPYTFYKPSREVIARLRPGDVVKLIFRFESDDPDAPSAERMWVIVDECLADGHFRGRLDNQPRHIKDLHHLDEVTFSACHVINTQIDDDDNLVERYILRCFVTARVLEDGQKVGYLYREAPDDDTDSGWRFMAGDESETYMDDAKNFSYVSLGAVLSRDDSFRDLLESPVGSVFVRHPETGLFEPDR